MGMWWDTSWARELGAHTTVEKREPESLKSFVLSPVFVVDKALKCLWALIFSVSICRVGRIVAAS